MAEAANQLIRQNPTIYPFYEARLEGFGTGATQRKRKDLRFFNHQGKLVLCGEVKLPGKPEGQSPLNHTLVTDAASKADNAGVQYFFTWNVNQFALWDRGLWDRPWFERRVCMWNLQRTFTNAQDVAREENLQFIKTHFLPNLLRDLADIISGRRRDWSMPPDDIFIRSLESHLEWPVLLTSSYALNRAEKERGKGFDLRMQQWMTAQDWTFVRSPHEEWAKAVDNMAKTLAYVWANRLIFYKALRARFPDLPRLELKKSVTKPSDALAAFNSLFKKAVERSGDYEPLLMPEAHDWATELVFYPPNALDAWRGLLRGIEWVDFREVPSDVVGRIFQKLIGPDERHRYGQHFTGDDVVDLINGFCIRNAADTILDPACGSGSFLVRAYYRKRHLDPHRSHVEHLSELFGCDIALYPAHLATLNLAAREINDEANYPRVARRNFFDFEAPNPFCQIPSNDGALQAIPLPSLDAVVGNPPYVRQEKVVKTDKKRFGEICSTAWSGFRLNGRSDLYCYFWPAAARFLKTDGYFGFLTSSSWMDVEYGFALQAWMLQHFRILAVMESAAEPWFEDARVKTCVTILQRCEDEKARMANRVRFVRFAKKLSEIIGIPPGQDEHARQSSVEALRNRILGTGRDLQDDDLRIIVKTQSDLWEAGVRAGEILIPSDAELSEPAESSEEDEITEEESADAEMVDRPIVRGAILDRFVLLVDQSMDRLKNKAPWVWRYIRYGATATFASQKSKGKPVPERPTCKARDPWYDLTGLVKPGFAFWPKSQQYRHIVPANPERVICNCNLYDVASEKLNEEEQSALIAVLNSTLVGLFKTFYGRFAGTEGNLKTEVVDVHLLEIPDPRGVSPQVVKRLSDALAQMSKREVGRLVEEQLMDCHTPERARKLGEGPLVYSDELGQPDRRALDDAVFEMLGVSNADERKDFLDKSYEATARHFRDIRVVEIEKMQQRAKSENKRFTIHDLAADIWDAADLDDLTPLAEWVSQRLECNWAVNIPDERPAVLKDDPLYGDNGVYFGKSSNTHIVCDSREHAELVMRLANLGVSGNLKVPGSKDGCSKVLELVNARMKKANARFKELAESRTGDERVRQQLMEALERWFVVGRDGVHPDSNVGPV